MTTQTPLYFITETIANPLYDGRATAGLRSLKELDAGTRFVVSRNWRTGEAVSIRILWDAFVHPVSLTSGDARAANLLALLTNDDTALETEPHSLDTCMMVIDPYWDGKGCSPSVADAVLDRMIRDGEIAIDRAMELLTAADAEARR